MGIGHRFDPDLILSTARLDRIIAWEPDDLTVVVEAGVTVEDLEEMLAGKGQTALLSEQPGPATVGGAVAAAISGWRRFRYGPLRDRVLEVTLVTSDGRVVTAGGRLVKNVTGYDIPRLAAGSFGSLGLIARVCLKLWPLPAACATVRVSSGRGSAGPNLPSAGGAGDRPRRRRVPGGHPGRDRRAGGGARRNSGRRAGLAGSPRRESSVLGEGAPFIPPVDHRPAPTRLAIRGPARGWER